MSADSKKTVFVTGATGAQGGAVARHLLKAGHTVRALTRNPDSPKAAALTSAGAEVVKGSFSEPASITAAAKGTDATFAMGTPYEGGPAQEMEEGRVLLDALLASGTGHVVYNSVGGSDKDTGVPHFDSKWEVEKHLQGLDVPSTVIGPVWFMENLLGPWFLPGVKSGTLALAMPGDRPLQQISVDNIGAVAAAVIAAGEPYYGKRFDIAGDELTCVRMMEIVSAAAGREIKFEQMPIEPLREQNEDFARMFQWFTDVGYSADLSGLRNEFPDVGWVDFEQWAKAQDWAAALA